MLIASPIRFVWVFRPRPKNAPLDAPVEKEAPTTEADGSRSERPVTPRLKDPMGDLDSPKTPTRPGGGNENQSNQQRLEEIFSRPVTPVSSTSQQPRLEMAHSPPYGRDGEPESPERRRDSKKAKN